MFNSRYTPSLHDYPFDNTTQGEWRDKVDKLENMENFLVVVNNRNEDIYIQEVLDFHEREE